MPLTNKKQIGNDMRGNPVFNGDRVISFNLTPWATYGPGVPAILVAWKGMVLCQREGTKTHTHCHPSDPCYGVLKPCR